MKMMNISDYCNGYAIVELNGKYNFINQNGNTIAEKWYDEVCDFDKRGYARVRLDKKYNHIDTNGKLISEEWFDFVLEFNDGYAPIKLNKKWNYINESGKTISEQWFDSTGTFRNGYGVVGIKPDGKINKKYNFIDKDGNIVSERWFENAFSFDKNGQTMIKLDGKWEIIDINKLKTMSPKKQEEGRNVVELSGMVVSCKVNNSEDEEKAYVHLELCTSSETERNEKGQTVLKNPMYHRIMTTGDNPIPERILKLQQKLEDDIKKWMTGMMEQNQPAYISVKGVLVSNLMKNIDPYVLAKPEDIRITDKPLMKNSMKLEGQIVDTFTNPIYATMVIKSQTPNGLDTYIEVILKEQDNMKRYNDICRRKVKIGNTVCIKGMLRSQHQSTGKGITFSCKVETNNFTNKTQTKKQEKDKGISL